MNMCSGLKLSLLVNCLTLQERRGGERRERMCEIGGRRKDRRDRRERRCEIGERIGERGKVGEKERRELKV